jgi:hypothetical protein
VIHRDKHAPNTLENYLMLHDKHLREREYFIQENGLQPPFINQEGNLRIVGLLRCNGHTYLNVSKTIRIRPDGWVETIEYAYHGGVSHPNNRNIFRFDNAHGVHEQHVFDPETGEELGLPRQLTRDEWPHLSECLDMLEAWCFEYGTCGKSQPGTK